MSKFVVIAKYSFAHEANFAKMNLESAGIPAFIADEHTINMQWLYSDAMGGVRLLVDESFKEDALQVLNDDTPVILDEAFNEQLEEQNQTDVKSTQTEPKPIPILGYVALQLICWFLVFKSAYFTFFTFNNDGFFTSLPVLIKEAWVPIGLLCFFYANDSKDKGDDRYIEYNTIKGLIINSAILITVLGFLVWLVKT